MARLFLALGLLFAAACTPTEPYYGGGSDMQSGLPEHPDPLCFYTEPFEPGGPLGEVCA